MVNHLRRRPVFVDDGKCGTVYRIRNAELFAKGFDESRFARSHRSVERKNRVAVHPANKFSGGFANGFQIFYSNKVHLNIY
jgi:hypothetical protein